MHRIRYVVRTENAEHAADTVVMEEAREFSQKHLDEIISTIREITDEEYIKLFDQENDYLSHWTLDKKRQYITEISAVTDTDTETETT